MSDDGEMLREEELNHLCRRLADLRSERGWTLEELAERSGLSKPFLSRLEAGHRHPSIAAVLTLAKVYGISVAQLFDTQPTPEDPCVIVRGAGATAKAVNGLLYVPLSSSTKPFSLQPIGVTIPPDRPGNETYQHEGEEWLHVIDGRVRLLVDGKTHTLESGDSAHFDSRLAHRLDALDGKEARIILVACPIPIALNPRREAVQATAGLVG
ncbi:MAG TPA: XRE family transcriptional regulator [Tepidisphaeraceae bacterium]|nr:XRE family transcriptional regulator [Tepidisphaeraceae bacterium]